MVDFNGGWRRRGTLGRLAVATLATAMGGSLPATRALAAQPAGAVAQGSPAAPVAQGAMEQMGAGFWQTVVAKPAERPALIQRFFSPGIRERRGEAGLQETFSMLAEALGSELATARPTELKGNAREGELIYTLAGGRRVALMLTLTGENPALIERFGVRPLPPKVAALKPAQLPAAIDARLRAEAQAGRFSGAVLVARGEQLIHAGAVGLADRRSGRRNTVDTPFNLGSINKMFTAIAIAQLQAAGKLDWHDTVGRHLPNFPNAKIREQVTIHQLLTHRSGVGSYWNETHDKQRATLDSQQAFLQTFVDQPLLFEPGTRTEYSNGGVVILGLIIEALSGKDYYRYIREHLYQPAGMRKAEHFRRDDRQAGFALGYIKTEDGAWQDHLDGLSLRGSAAGGGYASVRDLQAFARALQQERLLPRAQLETLWKPRERFGPLGYGYLFTVGDSAGKRWVGHNGGAPGISAEFLFYPDDGLVIAVLANQDHAAEAMREWLHAQVEASLFTRP